jgi:myosin-1
MSVHADAPPPVVSDPSGLQYATGRQLGKGGFAICHHAELLERGNRTGNIIALKIVKSKMEPPKLAQKVWLPVALLLGSSKLIVFIVCD